MPSKIPMKRKMTDRDVEEGKKDQDQKVTKGALGKVATEERKEKKQKVKQKVSQSLGIREELIHLAGHNPALNYPHSSHQSPQEYPQVRLPE
jgi:hypothetical protein